MRKAQSNRRTKKELRDQEYAYRSLYDNAPIMMHSIEFKNRTLVSVNNHWLEVLGYERGEVIGRKFIDFLTPASRTYAIKVALPEFVKTGVAKDIEYQMVKKNGEVIDVLLSALGLRDEAGQVTGTQAFIVDVTERKRAEEEMSDREYVYRSLYDNAPIMMHSIEPKDGTLVSVNNHWLEVLGYGRSEVIGQSPTDFLTLSSRRDVVGEVLPEFFRTGFDKDIEIQMVKKSGEVIDVLLSAVALKDETGQITNTQAFIVDVTERKRAEEALRESEERFRELYEGAPLAYISVSLDGHIRMVNRGAEELLGYPRDALIGRSVIDLYADTPMGKEEARSIDKRTRAGEEFRDKELQMATAERRPVWVSVTVRPVRDRHGAIVERRGIVTDISERKSAEETRRELAVVEERNRLAREIHDTLAQSLIGIMIQLETATKLLVREPEAAGAEIQSARDLAQRSLEEARRSVWELHSARREFIDLTSAIRQEATSTTEDTVQLSVEVEGTEPESIDPRNELTALRIAQEALSNVRRHSKARRATVRLSYGVSEVRILISDGGVGFEPSRTKGILSATGGFGLTSMQERARLAGGNLEIRSAPGRGTQIDARIPYQVGPERPPLTQHTSRSAVPSQGGASDDVRILVVDDQEVVRRGIRSMLARFDGLVVVGEAGNGEEAIRQIRALAPDVVLMDIQMPKLDGVETTRQLRELGLDTHVILLSVYANDEYIFDGLRAGARGYLLKDVAEDDLVGAIKTVHGGGSLLEPVIASRLIEHLEGEPSPQLTKREKEVLGALASGARDKEIAGELSLSVRTIRFHVENIFQKLGVRTRTQAVRVASELRILDS